MKRERSRLYKITMMVVEFLILLTVAFGAGYVFWVWWHAFVEGSNG